VKIYVLLLCLSTYVQAEDVPALLRAVQERYNRAQTVQVHFSQTFKPPSRPPKIESGKLFLRRPGLMRWQYETPPGKLFISDGKFLYLYTPASNRVQTMRLRESDDLRTPLAFLLGRLDFWRDFERFVSRPEGASTRLRAKPRSERAPYSEIEFTVAPSRQITYLRVLGEDGSTMEFQLRDEKLNLPVEPALFRFTPPPGVEVIEGLTEEEGF